MHHSKLQDAINTAVYCSIFDSEYTVDLPKLRPELWESLSILTTDNKAENERLEFLGDALVDACIGIELYGSIPDGTPHKYTVRANTSPSMTIFMLTVGLEGGSQCTTLKLYLLTHSTQDGGHHICRYKVYRRCIRDNHGCLLHGEGVRGFTCMDQENVRTHHTCRSRRVRSIPVCHTRIL